MKLSIDHTASIRSNPQCPSHHIASLRKLKLSQHCDLLPAYGAVGESLCRWLFVEAMLADAHVHTWYTNHAGRVVLVSAQAACSRFVGRCLIRWPQEIVDIFFLNADNF